MGISFMIFLIYWIFIFGEYVFTHAGEWFVAISVHGVNLLLLLIDFAFHKIPVRIMHFVYSFVIGALFAVMSVVYTLSSKKPIYAILDWNTYPGHAVGYVIACFVLIFITQFLLYGLHRLKMRFAINERNGGVVEVVTS